MPKPSATIWSITSGLLLLTALPACAPRSPVEVEKPVPVVVPVKMTPPAELLACADRPAGLPENADLIAQIPTKLRAGIIRMARAFATNGSRLDRLIDWSAPGTCNTATKDAK